MTCRKESAARVVPPPSILFVTLDTTRADAAGPDAIGVTTPSFNALAARGRRFRWAYAAVPQTLPSHTSMLTGLYPAGHGVHENARHVGETQVLVSERLHAAGYRTAAFVSSFALAKRFGLARGFDLYDDEFPGGRPERTAVETTDRVIAFLREWGVGSGESETGRSADTRHPTPDTQGKQPLFLWVHYYDPHYPYTPPEPFRSRYPKQPYYGEVGFMDSQLGRLAAAFQQQVKGPVAIVVAGDHGEGLGEHGEQQHGDLLYQATMHVPLVLIGPRVPAGVSNTAVSTRRIFHTILDWAGIDATNSLLKGDAEVVVGEAMKPFLDFGWQPQVMAVDGNRKAILAGRLEVYDVAVDPGETHDLAAGASLSRNARAALQEYPIPSMDAQQSASNLSAEEQRKLAALGYVSSVAKPIVRADAPRPVDMAPMFPILDEAAQRFVREQYAQAIPLLDQILAKDPHNLDAALRLATAHSSLGHEQAALAAYRRAEVIAPNSADVRTYLALHYARTAEWPKAVPMLERIVAETPDKVPALEALALLRERQRQIDEAVRLRQKIYALRSPTAAELTHTGIMQMELGEAAAAVESFEKSRALEGSAFRHDTELGVLYLALRRFDEARTALDRVPATDPEYAMALFKRAQVSVLLHEPDAPARIAAAHAHSDALTRPLITRERLFQQQ
ncbi:MAG TPA: sulfatase-like hydrolase/transferase [Thermoanaerobaculia bacterium]|jgi:arylsulfatase A-like enzyme/Flp pilus assembly protein TadD|nr:sulfatase-like hydrolase/transferase [Thermoanaerobaculia bacterium]